MNRVAIAVLIVFSAFTACKRDDDVPDDPTAADTTLDLSSQYFTDVNGQPAGKSGNPEDFQQETWEQWVKAHFAALDTATLPVGSASANQVERVSIFPNPGTGSRAMYVLGIDSMNVKLVLVNRQRTAKWKTSLNIHGSSNSALYAIQFPADAIAGDSLYRLYYAFSLGSSPFFHTSHVDVTVR